MELGALRARRLRAKIPAVSVATRARVDRCRYSLLENGHIQPRHDELARLAAALQALIHERTKDLLALDAGSGAIRAYLWEAEGRIEG
jgi:transcriptional regulator with XRE-family HTH domain